VEEGEESFDNRGVVFFDDAEIVIFSFVVLVGLLGLF
jgi:hypothetical protein